MFLLPSARYAQFHRHGLLTALCEAATTPRPCILVRYGVITTPYRHLGKMGGDPEASGRPKSRSSGHGKDAFPTLHSPLPPSPPHSRYSSQHHPKRRIALPHPMISCAPDLLASHFRQHISFPVFTTHYHHRFLPSLLVRANEIRISGRLFPMMTACSRTPKEILFGRVRLHPPGVVTQTAAEAHLEASGSSARNVKRLPSRRLSHRGMLHVGGNNMRSGGMTRWRR